MNGRKNARYDDKVRNFFIALAASGNKQAYEFVSGNLGMCMAHRHSKRCIAKRRAYSFINLSDNEVIALIDKRITAIRDQFGDKEKTVSFSVGIDATVLVKAFQYSAQLGKIVGGVYPNQCIDVRGKSSEEIHAILKDCIDGKYGLMADEVKVAVVSFQDTPPGMCLYLVLAGNAQTSNKNNDFGKRTVQLCTNAARNSGNAFLLNHSTMGCLARWIGTNRPSLITWMGYQTHVLYQILITMSKMLATNKWVAPVQPVLVITLLIRHCSFCLEPPRNYFAPKIMHLMQ